MCLRLIKKKKDTYHPQSIWCEDIHSKNSKCYAKMCVDHPKRDRRLWFLAASLPQGCGCSQLHEVAGASCGVVGFLCIQWSQGWATEAPWWWNSGSWKCTCHFFGLLHVMNSSLLFLPSSSFLFSPLFLKWGPGVWCSTGLPVEPKVLECPL